MRRITLTVFLIAPEVLHAGHDVIAVDVLCRHKRLPEDSSASAAHVVVVYAHVHLPRHVVREVDLIGGITHSHLVQPSVGQADGGLGGLYVEGGVLGLMGEHTAGFPRGVDTVLDALPPVSRRRSS